MSETYSSKCIRTNYRWAPSSLTNYTSPPGWVNYREAKEYQLGSDRGKLKLRDSHLGLTQVLRRFLQINVTWHKLDFSIKFEHTITPTYVVNPTHSLTCVLFLFYLPLVFVVVCNLSKTLLKVGWDHLNTLPLPPFVGRHYQHFLVSVHISGKTVLKGSDT